MKKIVASWILIAGLFGSCQTAKNEKEEVPDFTHPQPVLSFSGNTLKRKVFLDSLYRRLLNQRIDAKTQSEQYPDSAELAIWYGRREAYLGRYHEAIEIFTQAISKFPQDYRLLRHRGHRYLTTRQVDLAIIDLEKSNKLADNVINAIEPDGIPNLLNSPLSNDKFNIYYHQGLAYYINGEFEKAVSTYEQCLAVSDNDDLLVATIYWQYMTLQRLGRVVEANTLLSLISGQMTIIENDSYLDLLMLFKGNQKVDALKDKAMNADGSGNPTMMYGIGNWYLQQNNYEEAERIWKGILKQKSWDSFGYIAAEAEFLRAR